MSSPRFRAVLSDGTVVTEGEADWKIVPGERHPWIRLTKFAQAEGLYLVDFRLEINGHIICLPPEKYNRFGLKGIPPNFYSLTYHLEIDDLNGSADQSKFVDLAAHYKDFVIHLIHDITENGEAVVIVTSAEDDVLAPSPTGK